eukprot:SAG11_NODE_18607_length_484_cov_0.798450_1_plen_37_part_10
MDATPFADVRAALCSDRVPTAYPRTTNTVWLVQLCTG